MKKDADCHDFKDDPEKLGLQIYKREISKDQGSAEWIQLFWDFT